MKRNILTLLLLFIPLSVYAQSHEFDTMTENGGLISPITNGYNLNSVSGAGASVIYSKKTHSEYIFEVKLKPKSSWGDVHVKTISAANDNEITPTRNYGAEVSQNANLQFYYNGYSHLYLRLNDADDNVLFWYNLTGDPSLIGNPNYQYISGFSWANKTYYYKIVRSVTNVRYILRETDENGTLYFDETINVSDLKYGSDPEYFVIGEYTNSGTYYGNMDVWDYGIISGIEQDSLALVALYDSTAGASWTNSINWKTTATLDQWYGVTVTNGRVTTVDLQSNNLTGFIPTTIGNLTALTILDLRKNSISGAIPPEIGNLHDLITFELSENSLTGTIPTEICNLSQLNQISLWTNSLSGTIPTDIGNLTNMSYLYLRDNQLTGIIPTSIGSLTSMLDMRLDSNQLTGTIPTGIGNLTSLTTLHLNNNQLTGGIPSSIGNLLSLESLVLNDNSLTDSIPTEIGNLSNLLNLSLGVNNLTGIIPLEIFNLTSLSQLYLGANQLTGIIPTEIGNLSALSSLLIGGNQFTGEIPSSIGSLTNLSYLDLGSNNLAGSIPTELGNLTNLTYLYLRYNNLTGVIPSGFGDFSSLGTINISDNKLTGSIPSGFAGMPLTEFQIQNNYFNSLPDISAASNLATTNIFNNNFTFEDIEPNIGISGINYSPQDSVGVVIDSVVADGANISIFANVGGANNVYNWYKNGVTTGQAGSSLIINGFSGGDAGTYWAEVTNTVVTGLTIPTHQIKLIHPATVDSLALVALYNSTNGDDWTDNSNWLSTEPISNWFGVTTSDSRVTELRLWSNNLNGTIPSQFYDLTSMTDIQLGKNKLSGSILQELCDLINLTYINLTFNDFSGSIPTEIGNLTNLTHLMLYSNNFSGNIPSRIGDLTQLMNLNLGRNNMIGSIPPSIGNLSNATLFGLNGNNLSGSIPAEIGNMVSLENLYLSENKLTEIIPPEIWTLSNLKSLSLRDNNLTGNISKQIGQLSNLVSCGLAKNQFSGTIPPEIGDLASLKVLELNNNQLTGNIPEELTNLTALHFFGIGTNNLTGAIPSGMENLTNLEYFIISNNKLSGKIPTELFSLTLLEFFKIDNNLFSGKFPSELTELTYLKELQIQNNSFNSIHDFSELPNLSLAILSNNAFTFEDIAPNAGVNGVEYSPQDSVGVPVSKYLSEGDSYSHTVVVGGTGNQYQWYKDGRLLSGQNSDVLSILSYTNNQAGVYICRATNPSVPGLTIYSHPLTLEKSVGLTGLEDITVYEGDRIDFIVPSKIYDASNPVIYSMEAPTLPNGAGASFNSTTKRFLWNTNFKHAGVYPVTFIVSNGIETDTKTITITILNVDHTGGMSIQKTEHIKKSSGGTVQVESTGAYKEHKVNIPPNAMKGDDIVIVGPPDPTEDNIPQEELDACPSAVDFTVEGFEDYTFEDSVEITIEFKEFEVSDKKENMKVHFWDKLKQRWKRVMAEQEIDETNNTVKVKTKHFSIYAVIEVLEATETYSIGRGWNMTAIPVETEGTNDPVTLLSSFFDYFNFENRDSHIYEYDESSSAWVLPSQLQYGTGYLIYGEEPTDLEITGLEVTGDFTRNLSLTGSNGWHMMGNPYNLNAEWGTDIIGDSDVDNIFYRWEGGEYLYYPGGGLSSADIDPWQAFWVHTNADAAALDFVYPGPAPPKTQSSSDEQDFTWKMQFVAKSDELKDTYNFIGQSEYSIPGRDRKDAYELAPLSSEFVSLSFDVGGTDFTQSITDISDEAVWNMKVVSKTSSGDVSLQWIVPAELDGYDLTLQTGDGELVDMRTQSAFSFSVSTQTAKISALQLNQNEDPTLSKVALDGSVESHFIVTMSKHVEEDDAAIPTDYYLNQNYPNPFNPNTKIEYGLPEAGHVTLTIYNMLGQEIATLVNTVQNAGRFSVNWNGRNSMGRKVTSGVYIYKITSGSYTKVNKMLLIK